MLILVRVIVCLTTMFFVPLPAHSQNLVPVVVVTPKIAESLSPLRFNGTVTPQRLSELSPHVDGLVISAEVDDGHVARRGDGLVVLDATLAKLELHMARARLDEARARLDDATRLREEAERLGQNISQSTLRSRVARENIEAAIMGRLEVELEFQKELVDRHTIRAPFDGIVLKKLTEVGEWAEAARPVLRFLGVNQIRLDIQVPQDYYPVISYENSALVRVDALPEELFTAQVLAIVPASDPDARTFLVRLLLDDPSHEIIVGMSAEASFSVSNGKGVVEIPRDAVVLYPDGSTSVWVVEDTGDGLRAYERQVVVGVSLGENIKVIQGIDHASPVVVRGNETLEEAAMVRLVERLPDRNGATEVNR